jgi:hypothetical protein
MNPLLILQAALGIGQTVGGIMGLSNADKVPAELQDLYNLLKERATTGLGDEKGQMLSSGLSGLNRQATGAQARGSMALASRGIGNSSQADSMLADISSGTADAYQSLVSRINTLDQEIKQNATSQLGRVVNSMNAVRQGKQEAAGKMLGGGLGILSNPATYGIISENDKLLGELLKMLQGKQWDSPSTAVGTPFEPNYVS